MTEYNVTAVAEELMLDVADLQEVYELFFDDAQDLLLLCKQYISEQNDVALTRALHNLKGAATNLRMQEIGALVAELEQLVVTGTGAQVEPYLSKLHCTIDLIKKYINKFYAISVLDRAD